jgi:trigger factor
MQVSLEATGTLERRMTVEVPNERVQGEVDRRLQQLARTTKVKGFRPGKVPLKVVANQYGEQVRQEVMGEVIQASFYEAVAQEKLHPAGMPRIEPASLEEGKGLAYTAVFEVMPEIDPAPLAGVALDKVTAEVTDADLDAMFETLRKQATAWQAVDRAAQDGDRVIVDFSGTIDGAPFKGNEGSNVPVTLGSGRMIDGFEAGLVGAKAGDERVLDLKFPDDYAYKEVAGKAVRFTAKVNAVEEPKLPEIDEEFAKRFGVDSVDALRSEVRANMERELGQTLRNRNKQAVMDKLVELNRFDVPKALIENESQALMEQMRRNLQTSPGREPPALDTSMFAEQATRRVTLGLILAEIIKRNSLKADADKVRAQVEEIAASYERPDEVMKWYYGDRRRLSDVESVVLEEQVVDWALAQADITEKKVAFEEVMNRGR